jgi:putative endonuclease
MMAKHNQTGNLGEELACSHLSGKGYDILERNWRFSRSEIDIICKQSEILVFVEVKTRTSIHFGFPEEFVTERKEELIMDAASEYMKQIKHEWEIRFDIISVILHKHHSPTIRHIKDAFFPTWDDY